MSRPSLPIPGGRTVRTFVMPPDLVRRPSPTDPLEYTTRSMVWGPGGEWLFRAWGPADAPWILAVSPGRSRWKIESWGASSAVAREAVRTIFSFDHRIEEFYRLVRHEPVLRGTDRRFRGLRLPRDASLYESLLHAIVGQQLSVRAAATISERLLESTRAFADVRAVRVPLPPPPGALRRLGANGLCSVGLSQAKASSLLALADAETAGRLDGRRYRSIPLEEAIEELDALPGVGRWTAENALLRSVGRTDVFVAGDLGLRAALEKYGVLPRHAEESKARAWAERYYPGWGSYATIYLWKKLMRDRREEAGSLKDPPARTGRGAVP